MELLVEKGEELESVIGGGVWDPHHFRKNQKHEEILLFLPGTGQSPPMRGIVELPKELQNPSQPTLQALTLPGPFPDAFG